MGFPMVIYGTPGDQYAVHSAGQNNLNTMLILGDGRAFRYGSKGTTTAVAGDVQSSRALDANHILQTPSAAAAVGASSVSVTLGATAAVINLYADGYLAIELGTGFGYNYTIASHAAVASAGVLTAVLQDTVQVPIPTTANTVSFVANRCASVVVAPTTETGTLAGVAVKPLTAGQFGYFQTKGAATVTAVGTIVNGETVAVITTAGAVGPAAAVTTNLVGIAMHTASATNKAVIDLSID